ncbi:hypothetical protein BH10PSE14_BH10PSE14_09930 [soil metagenome]
MNVAMKSNKLAVTSRQVPITPFVPHLVADTLETRLVEAIAASRASPNELATQDDAFRRACRRDAIAAIELGRAIGLLRQAAKPVVTLCDTGSEIAESE